MLADKQIFDEKQYMGHNRLSMIWRTIIALFCFVGYYWSENPKPVQIAIFRIGYYPALDIPNSGKIFFLLGLLIMLFSVMLTFILHTHTKVFAEYIVIDGFWTARRVKINLDTITHIRKSRYKKHIFRRAVYNLHSRGIIRFFTSGNEFVEIKDRSGFTYRIGTQKAPELYQVLKKQLREIHQTNL
ncbi:MAG: hypothetical protein HY062_03720 [Bacteroidetes bacterium]|nr:hypothetical protein [Bacteroidota bacterium]